MPLLFRLDCTKLCSMHAQTQGLVNTGAHQSKHCLCHSMTTKHPLHAGTVSGAGAQRTLRQGPCSKESLLPDQCSQPGLTKLQTSSAHWPAQGLEGVCAVPLGAGSCIFCPGENCTRMHRSKRFYNRYNFESAPT